MEVKLVLVLQGWILAWTGACQVKHPKHPKHEARRDPRARGRHRCQSKFETARARSTLVYFMLFYERNLGRDGLGTQALSTYCMNTRRMEVYSAVEQLYVILLVT